jgi:hypothetical protein
LRRIKERDDEDRLHAIWLWLPSDSPGRTMAPGRMKV